MSNLYAENRIEMAETLMDQYGHEDGLDQVQPRDGHPVHNTAAANTIQDGIHPVHGADANGIQDGVYPHGAAASHGIQNADKVPCDNIDDTSTDLDLSVRSYKPVEEDNNLTRQPTLLSRVQTSLSFFNPKLKNQRKRIVMQIAGIYLLMAVLCLGIFSIYWGSMVGRNDRLVNLDYLVVIEDSNVGEVDPIIGDSFQQLLTNPLIMHVGTWHVFNASAWAEVTAKSGRTSEEEVISQIHEHNYWSAIYIKENATANWINAIEQGDLSYNVSNSTISNIYETGRDFLAMNTYVTPQVKNVEHAWLGLQQSLVEKLNLSDLSSNSIAVVSTPLKFTYYDFVPYTDPVLVAPSQVGLIYMIIITFFQFNFFAELHKEVAQLGMKKIHYVLYRILTGWLSYFVLSLMFGLVSLACQVDFTVTFGHSGFLVYWMIAFLTMIAVGTVNEIMGLLCILLYPPILGFWLLFWVIINIAPTFVPMQLSAEFFRYGYAMPIHNSYEATKPIFFNVTKKYLGRNVGVLVAWCVVSTLLLIPTLAFFGKTMGRRAMLAAQKAKQEAMEKESQEKADA